MPRRSEWFRRHPFIADVLLALPLLLLGLLSTGPDAALDERYRDPNALIYPLAILMTAPLAWRRRAPVPVLAISAVALAIHGAIGFQPTLGGLATAVAVYTVASTYPGPAGALRATGASVVLVLASPFLHDGRLYPGEFAAASAAFGIPWLIGRRFYRSRAFTASLVERAARAEREREQAAVQAVTDERARIARELHDVVAHAISVAIVQAGAARRVLRANPDRADEAIAAIEKVGRQALAEMRRLVELMRQDHEEDVLVPQPGVDQIAALIKQVQEAGLSVDLTIEGEVRALPASVDLSAYRIVQEALTNTLKHAGPARAHVLVRYGTEEIELAVSDDGERPMRMRNGSGGGHGLIGMRERVSLLGGSFSAGPEATGGFEVRALLPIDGHL